MSRPCPSCGADSLAGAIFCASCGTELPAACPRCSTAVPVGARFCPSCGLPLTVEPSAEERKLMTVVFVDPVDSTALAEGRDSERVRAILQSYFSTTSSTVQAWGGTVEKYIGDAVVAVFGVPRIREDDPVRALSAALEIVDGVGELAADLARRSDVELRVPVRAASRPWLLAAALETYEALGARPHAARAQAALATVGAVDAGSRTGPG